MVEHQFESLHFAYLPSQHLPDHHLADHFADPGSVPVLVLVLVFDLAVLILLICLQ